MTHSPPPDQRPPRLRDDEPIALLVTFLTFGAIFTWVLTQGRNTWDLSSFLPGVGNAPTATVSPAPTVSPPAPPAAPAPPAPPTGVTGNLGNATGNVTGNLTPPAGSAPQPPAVIPPTAEVSPPGGQLPPAPVPTTAPTPNPPGVTPTRPAPPTVVGKVIVFPDVPSNYWAAPFIAALSARGIIGGFPDGSFRPNEPVTRAQYAVQLQKAFTKPDRRPPKSFTDVPADSRWATAVDQAVKANFMSGYPEGDFRPEQQVSRVEAVASMMQGLGIAEPADPEAILQPYSDRDQIPSWARGRMAAAIQAGLFTGDSTTQQLQPTQAATRADIAALVFRGIEFSQAKR